MPFLWCPGQGCDTAALARMREAFPVPRQPMGEAWFMGETRSMYDWLYGDLDALPLRKIDVALEAIASGTSAFGSHTEWEEWFGYLVPRLVPRAHESFYQSGSAILDALVTAFIAQYPAGVAFEPYPDFRVDALNTLGRAMMDECCWPDGDLDVAFGLSRGWYAGIASWQWWMVSGKLSASLFFCLKYLDAADVAPWLQSVLTLRSPYFVGQMIAWLVGAYPLLTGAMAQPADLPAQGYPEIVWFWSHCLCGNYTGDHSGSAPLDIFLPEANRSLALAQIAAHLDGPDAAGWLAEISVDPTLEAELDDLPFALCRLYARH